METSAILIFLMLFALLLSMVSLVIAIVFLLKTNTRLKNLVRSVKLFAINSLVERVMKKDNQYENFDGFFQESVNGKSKISSNNNPRA